MKNKMIRSVNQKEKNKLKKSTGCYLDFSDSMAMGV